MSRRDTIIVAVLLNIGLLAVLFIMAASPEDERLIHHHDIQKTLAEASQKIVEPEKNVAMITPITNIKNSDEVDIVLKDFAETIKSNSVKELATLYPAIQREEELILNKNYSPKENYHKIEDSTEKGDYIEITVKSGDILGRIAQTNNTTVSAIKKLNNLTSDNLRVGQILKIPVGIKSPTTTPKAKKENSSEESLFRFYTVQEKDNPWKIAKKFNVSVQELLILNDLDESKARNLKPGDRIRVQ